MKKIGFLISKEWAEVFRNKLVIFSVVFMPLVFSIIPLGMLYTTVGADLGAVQSEFGPLLTALESACGELQGLQCTQLILLQQFLVLFLLMPAIIPITIASYSIVGEKTTRTLEPLLATPITTGELLAGKALAAALPALLASLASFTIFAIGTSVLAGSEVAGRLLSPLWLLGIFVVGPLVSVTGVSLAIMISSRVNDPRAAEQLAALLILPVMALFLGQMFGAVVLNQSLLLSIAGALVLIDLALLYFAIRLFQRETILTRWR